MGVINLYKGLSSERIIYNFNGVIKDNLKLNWDYVDIFKGSQKLDQNYEVEENDILIIYEYHGMTVVAIVLTVVTIGVAIGVGIYAKQQAEKAKREMEEALKRIGKDNKQKEVSSIPMLADARNERADGKNAPIIIGRHLFAPYFISEPYMRPSGIDGVDLYWYGSFLVGQDGLCFEKIKNGSIDLVTLTGDLPQVGIFNYDQPENLDQDNPPPFYDPENLIEISQNNYSFTNHVFEEKWVDSIDSSIEIGRRKKDNAQVIDSIYTDDNGAEPIIRETARFPMRAEIELFIDGLYGWDSLHGVETDATVGITLEWSIDQVNWNNINIPDFPENKITRAKSTQMRFLAEIDFPSSIYSKDGQPVFIRATRTTRMHTGGYRDRVYLSAIRTRQYNPKLSSVSEMVAAKNINGKIKNKFCRLGIKIKVNQNTQDFLDRFNVVASMTGRIWDGKWAETKFKTSNPASILLEILTGLIHDPSKYKDYELDFMSFKKLYEYCENQKIKLEDGIEDFKLEANGVITSGTKKIDILKSVMATCDAGLYVDEFGKLFVYYDDAQTVPIALLNPQVITKITTQKTLSRKSDGFTVEYIDQEAGWAQDTHSILKPNVEVNPGLNTWLPLKLELTTSYKQAMWHARRIMAKEKYRQSEYKVSVGKEGRFYKPGALIKVQHERFKIGLGSAEISEIIRDGNNITGLRLVEHFNIEKNKDYFVTYYVVDKDRNHLVTKQIQSTGELTNEVKFSIPIKNSIDIPQAGNILSVQNTERFLVSDLSETPNGYDLVLIPYNEEIYETTKRDVIPEYKANIISEQVNVYDSIGRKPIDGNLGQGLINPPSLPSLITPIIEDTVEEELGSGTFSGSIRVGSLVISDTEPLQLIDLPTAEPEEPNVVWRDGNQLMIS